MKLTAALLGLALTTSMFAFQADKKMDTKSGDTSTDTTKTKKKGKKKKGSDSATTPTTDKK